MTLTLDCFAFSSGVTAVIWATDSVLAADSGLDISIGAGVAAFWAIAAFLASSSEECAIGSPVTWLVSITGTGAEEGAGGATASYYSAYYSFWSSYSTKAAMAPELEDGRLASFSAEYKASWDTTDAGNYESIDWETASSEIFYSSAKASSMQGPSIGHIFYFLAFFKTGGAGGCGGCPLKSTIGECVKV